MDAEYVEHSPKLELYCGDFGDLNDVISQNLSDGLRRAILDPDPTDPFVRICMPGIWKDEDGMGGKAVPIDTVYVELTYFGGFNGGPTFKFRLQDLIDAEFSNVEFDEPAERLEQLKTLRDVLTAQLDDLIADYQRLAAAQPGEQSPTR